MEVLKSNIRAFYLTEDAKERSASHAYLLGFQQSKEAWKIALDLCKENDVYCCEFSALVLQTKIKRESETMPFEHEAFCRELLGLIQIHVSNQNICPTLSSALCSAMCLLDRNTLELFTLRLINETFSLLDNNNALGKIYLSLLIMFSESENVSLLEWISPKVITTTLSTANAFRTTSTTSLILPRLSLITVWIKRCKETNTLLELLSIIKPLLTNNDIKVQLSAGEIMRNISQSVSAFSCSVRFLECIEQFLNAVKQKTDFFTENELPAMKTMNDLKELYNDHVRLLHLSATMLSETSTTFINNANVLPDEQNSKELFKNPFLEPFPLFSVNASTMLLTLLKNLIEKGKRICGNLIDSELNSVMGESKMLFEIKEAIILSISLIKNVSFIFTEYINNVIEMSNESQNEAVLSKINQVKSTQLFNKLQTSLNELFPLCSFCSSPVLQSEDLYVESCDPFDASSFASFFTQNTEIEKESLNHYFSTVRESACEAIGEIIALNNEKRQYEDYCQKMNSLIFEIYPKFILTEHSLIFSPSGNCSKANEFIAETITKNWKLLQLYFSLIGHLNEETEPFADILINGMMCARYIITIARVNHLLVPPPLFSSVIKFISNSLQTITQKAQQELQFEFGNFTQNELNTLFFSNSGIFSIQSFIESTIEQIVDSIKLFYSLNISKISDFFYPLNLSVCGIDAIREIVFSQECSQTLLCFIHTKMNVFGTILNTVLKFFNQLIISIDERTEKKYLWRKAFFKGLRNDDLINYCNTTKSSENILLLCTIARSKYIAETCNDIFALLSFLLLKQSQMNDKSKIENEIMTFISQIVATMKDDNFSQYNVFNLLTNFQRYCVLSKMNTSALYVQLFEALLNNNMFNKVIKDPLGKYVIKKQMEYISALITAAPESITKLENIISLLSDNMKKLLPSLETTQITNQPQLIRKLISTFPVATRFMFSAFESISLLLTKSISNAQAEVYITYTYNSLIHYLLDRSRSSIQFIEERKSTFGIDNVSGFILQTFESELRSGKETFPTALIQDNFLLIALSDKEEAKHFMTAAIQMLPLIIRHIERYPMLLSMLIKIALIVVVSFKDKVTVAKASQFLLRAIEQAQNEPEVRQMPSGITEEQFMRQNGCQCPSRTALYFIGRTLYDTIFVALLQHESNPIREFGAVINASLKLGDFFKQSLTATLQTPLPSLTPLTEQTRRSVAENLLCGTKDATAVLDNFIKGLILF